MSEPLWLSPAEQRAWRAYMQMRHLLDAEIERNMAQNDLSTADYALLAPLSEAADYTLRPRDLGAAVSWERSRLSHQLRRMERRGLVTRLECATDARGTFVRLTPAGLAAIQNAAPGHVAQVRRSFIDLLSGEELQCLEGIATKVIERHQADLCGSSATDAECDG